MKTKKWTYHKTHSFIDIETNTKVEFITQQYQVGVYAIINGDPSLQFNYKPQDVVKIEKYVKKMESEGKIKDLTWGREITVTTDESGLYVEV